MTSFQFTIVARKRTGEIVPPRTLKNSPQLIPHMKFPILVPSEAYREWERAAKRDGSVSFDGDKPEKPIAYPVNCRAIFYRDRNVGDAVGFYQGLGDFLQLVGIVENDRYIVQWDGTRLAKDVARPRIEVELTSVEAAPLFG